MSLTFQNCQINKFFVLNGSFADDPTVSVAKDNIKAHTGDDIELECFGSKTDFIYYIRNR